jgi:hypothetical protein
MRIIILGFHSKKSPGFNELTNILYIKPKIILQEFNELISIGRTLYYI